MTYAQYVITTKKTSRTLYADDDSRQDDVCKSIRLATDLTRLARMLCNLSKALRIDLQPHDASKVLSAIELTQCRVADDQSLLCLMSVYLILTREGWIKRGLVCVSAAHFTARESGSNADAGGARGTHA